MSEPSPTATLHSTKSDAELIEYGRDVIRTMKANGYGGIVWDEVLDRFERLKVQSATETLRVRCQPCGRITSDEGRCPDCPDRGTEPPPPQEARAPSATSRAFEEKPSAWLIERPRGAGKQQKMEYQVVLSPLTDDTFMDEGDCAYPLFREVYTQERLDEAERVAGERHKKLRVE